MENLEKSNVEVQALSSSSSSADVLRNISVHGQIWESDGAYLEERLPELCAHLDDEGRQLVKRAAFFAAAKHRGQKRISGDDYIVHLVESAQILAQYKLDAPTLAVALMHDLLEEHTSATLGEVKAEFGSEIASMVDGVTRLTGLFSRQERAVRREAIGGRSAQEGSSETLRKIFLAIAADLRVVLVKVADRLHNLRTLYVVAPDVQLSIAHETLDIFAPIVSRLGIREFKFELENLAFRYAYPQEYERLEREVEDTRQKRVAVLMECVEAVKKKLAEAGIEAEIQQRTKHLYSIFRKLQRQHSGLDEIYDLQAIRIIVPKVEDCYAVLSMVHEMWVPLEDRIKDYIAKPKLNNYRSLHTTVLAPQDMKLEVQIRTFAMHQYNEFGIAAHFAYKEGRKAFSKGSSDGVFRELYPWIRALFETQGVNQDNEEFSEHLKVSLLDKNIFVFTPRGDVVDLPRGATPIDFAYMVHTNVGHRCVGALVNNKMVALGYTLQNADVVTIQTAKKCNPSRDWLRICTTNQAKTKIRAWFKRERREENIQRGRDIIRKELNHRHLDDSLPDDAVWEEIAALLKFASVDDMLASLGYGETSFAQIWGRLQTRIVSEPKAETLPSKPNKAPAKSKNGGRDVIVDGLDNLLTKMAHCCNPAPGDEVLGYISVGKGLTVHRCTCRSLQQLRAQHPERLVTVRWANVSNTQSKYAVSLTIEAHDRPSLLGDVLALMNEMRLTVRSCNASAEDGRAVVQLNTEVSNTEQVAEVSAKLRRIKSVISVIRR